MGAARRPQATVGLQVMEELAERAMRSGRRIGLVIGCLAEGEQRVVGSGRVRNDAKDPPDGGTIFEIGSITKVFTASARQTMSCGGRRPSKDAAVGPTQRSCSDFWMTRRPGYSNL
jgi:serine-type D-Ala-D-Ala carboxypeptidase/endopeptidase